MSDIFWASNRQLVDQKIKTEMLFKLSNLNSNLAQTLGYLNPALNNTALEMRIASSSCHPQLVLGAKGNILRLQMLTILNHFLLLLCFRLNFARCTNHWWTTMQIFKDSIWRKGKVTNTVACSFFICCIYCFQP